MRHRTPHALLVGALGLPLLAGCSPAQVAAYDFVRDDRLRIVVPEDRAEVTLPLTLRWRVEGFTAVGRDGSSADDRGRFAVFVDRAPVRAGQTVQSVVADDDECAETPGCPDEEFLERQGVHLTSAPALLLDRLPELRRRPGAPDRHEVTVVLVDGRDRRIGEAAATVELTVARRSS